MTVLLYDYVELEERATKSYKLWKGCHITSYTLAAVFGLLNFYFLQQTMQVFDGRCALSPHELVFRAVSANDTFAPPQENEDATRRTRRQATSAPNSDPTPTPGAEPSTIPGAAPAAPPTASGVETVEIVNVTAANNETSESAPPAPDDTTQTAPLMLDVDESKFRKESACDLPLYTPLLAAVFGVVWCALFTVCPGGGRSRHGLSEPWRIVVPALVFALVLVALTGHNFVSTDRGLRALCTGFQNVTNTTSCTRGMDAHVAGGSWAPASVAVGAARAACAGAWACWAAACALLLARCLAGADFAVRRTEVHLRNHPDKKRSPLLTPPQKIRIARSDLHASPQHPGGDLHASPQHPGSSVAAGDDVSVDSDPTLSTDLTVSAAPPHLQGRSLNSVKADRLSDNEQYLELS